MLQSESVAAIIDSSHVLHAKVTEALIRVNDLYNQGQVSESPTLHAANTWVSHNLNAI